MLRRIFDILMALIALVVLMPLLFLITILIKLDSPGPLFYRTQRMGKDSVPFFIWKFRSMTVGADKLGKRIAEPEDHRITHVGEYIRLFKIDELPQLFNVIVGEMSIIGPRPEECDIVEQYYTNEQRKILSLKPGLTGLHQVTAFPDMTDEVPDGVNPQEYYLNVQLHNRLAVELDYLRERGFWLDARIVVQTFSCLLVKSWLYLLFKRRVWMRENKVVQANAEMGGRG